MENKNEINLRAYVRPEAEEIVFKYGNICGGIEEGSGTEEDDEW